MGIELFCSAQTGWMAGQDSISAPVVPSVRRTRNLAFGFLYFLERERAPGQVVHLRLLSAELVLGGEDLGAARPTLQNRDDFPLRISAA